LILSWFTVYQRL